MVSASPINKIVPKAHLTYSRFTFTSYFKNRAAEQPDFLSSSALGAVVGPDGGELGIRFGHECLQLFLEQLVSGLGCSRLHGSAALGAGLLGPVLILETGVLPTGSTVAATEVVGPGGGIFTLGLGLQALDGQVDFAVFVADDHDLHILTLGQMLADVTDIGIGNLRNMYHAGLVFGQCDKCAEIGDGFYFAL